MPFTSTREELAYTAWQTALRNERSAYVGYQATRGATEAVQTSAREAWFAAETIADRAEAAWSEAWSADDTRLWSEVWSEAAAEYFD